MNDPTRDFNEVIRAIQKDDPRYERGAYYFLRQALDYTLREFHKSGKLDKTNHLTGQQLLEGIRLYAIDQYGPMARTVLENWGVKNCRDFGNIVFNLVECKVLGKTDQDSPEDFAGGYTFSAAFDQPFRPNQIKPTTKRPPLR
ncbi:MAG: Minf_1886 family protein [Opitutales bacterium]